MVQKVLGYPGKFPDNLESFSEQQIPGQGKKSKFGLNIIWMIFLFRNKQYDIVLLQEFGACALFDLEWSGLIDEYCLINLDSNFINEDD